MGRRVGDAGRSAGPPVRGWRGVEHAQQHSTRKRADFPCGSCITRDFGQPIQETKQMTAVATPAGAVSRNAVDWHAMKWQKAHSIVRRLQARIVKATQAGRWGKVRALQRLLTHSFSAKMLAVKRVTEKQRKRTPGGGGGIWGTPGNKNQAGAPP